MRSFCTAKASLILSTKNTSVFGYKVVKHLTSWLLNELVKLTMLWTTEPRPLFKREAKSKMSMLLLLMCSQWLKKKFQSYLLVLYFLSSLSELSSLELELEEPELELSELNPVGFVRSTLSASAATSGLSLWKFISAMSSELALICE